MSVDWSGVEEELVLQGLQQVAGTASGYLTSYWLLGQGLPSITLRFWYPASYPEVCKWTVSSEPWPLCNDGCWWLTYMSFGKHFFWWKWFEGVHLCLIHFQWPVSHTIAAGSLEALHIASSTWDNIPWDPQPCEKSDIGQNSYIYPLIKRIFKLDPPSVGLFSLIYWTSLKASRLIATEGVWGPVYK